LRWQYTAWRSASARWQVWGGGTQRRSRNALDDVELVLQRRHTRSADWGISAWLRFAMGELTLDADVAVPRRVGADTDVQLDPPPLARTQRVQASWQQPISLGANSLQYESRLLWLGVRHPASGADLQNLGSRWTVRGFDGQRLLSGQEQVTWRQDLRLAAFTLAGLPGVQLQPSLALDCGRIGAAAPEALQPGRVLAGAAASLRWGRQGWRGDLTLAGPLYKPAGFSSSPVVIDASLNFNY
jgi:hemolysin activation/secretion protein